MIKLLNFNRFETVLCASHAKFMLVSEYPYCFHLLLLLVQEVQAEGKMAIDSPGSPTAPEIPPEEYSLRKIF